MVLVRPWTALENTPPFSVPDQYNFSRCLRAYTSDCRGIYFTGSTEEVRSVAERQQALKDGTLMEIDRLRMGKDLLWNGTRKTTLHREQSSPKLPQSVPEFLEAIRI